MNKKDGEVDDEDKEDVGRRLGRRRRRRSK